MGKGRAAAPSRPPELPLVVHDVVAGFPLLPTQLDLCPIYIYPGNSSQVNPNHAYADPSVTSVDEKKSPSCQHDRNKETRGKTPSTNLHPHSCLRSLKCSESRNVSITLYMSCPITFQSSRNAAMSFLYSDGFPLCRSSSTPLKSRSKATPRKKYGTAIEQSVNRFRGNRDACSLVWPPDSHSSLTVCWEQTSQFVAHCFNLTSMVILQAVPASGFQHRPLYPATIELHCCRCFLPP